MDEDGGQRRLGVRPEVRHHMFEAARRLRKQRTRGEQILWEALRGRRLAKRKFRRQQPVGAFIVDFFCAAERLVVEVDGAIHDDQREADAERQRIIESTGVRFLRLDTALVEMNLPGTLRQIEECFGPSEAR